MGLLLGYSGLILGRVCAGAGASQVALSGKEPACQYRRCKRCGFDPWVRKIPWRRAWQPTPVLLPGESDVQRSLAGYSPQGGKELDMTEATQPAHYPRAAAAAVIEVPEWTVSPGASGCKQQRFQIPWGRKKELFGGCCLIWFGLVLITASGLFY